MEFKLSTLFKAHERTEANVEMLNLFMFNDEHCQRV